jgi:AbrB family looped-hinge helix DNA binding protein
MTTTVLQVEDSAPHHSARHKSPDAVPGRSGAPRSAVAQAVVSSKGQVTLPAAMRAQLGIGPGSQIRFELRGRELVIKPELPISAYYGILKGYDLGDIEPEKEPDREFD